MTAATFALTAAPAQAAKPCWKQVIDDWVDNGRIDGVYSASCITAARRHVPEDIRAYTNIVDMLDSYRQDAVRALQNTNSSDAKPDKTTRNQRPNGAHPKVRPEIQQGPIAAVLGKGTTDADSIPIPLIVLAGLALLLMAAGGAGFAARKLQARRPGSGSS